MNKTLLQNKFKEHIEELNIDNIRLIDPKNSGTTGLDYISDFMKLANDIYYKGSYRFPSKKLEEEYHDKFGDFPPLNMTMSYSHPVYQYLMKKALNENKEISLNDLDSEMDKRHIKYDMDYD